MCMRVRVRVNWPIQVLKANIYNEVYLNCHNWERIFLILAYVPICVHAFVCIDVCMGVCRNRYIGVLCTCTWRPELTVRLPRLLSILCFEMRSLTEQTSRLAGQGVPGMPLTLSLQYCDYQLARPCLAVLT